jgi:tRNA A-37 threonylcarbamoyl transferase component Bud32
MADAPGPDTRGDVDSYRLIQTLTPERTFLCTDASANIVVLVRLEEDCLHRGMLHPAIRDRLARVRELPHPRVATLRGVERWNGIACLVWIYLDGENWDETLRANPARFPSLAAGLAAAVGALHDIGIVHGNLHGRNIIVRPDRQPWLTQLSPYLYTDPAVDVAAVVEMLRNAGEHLPEKMEARLAHVLDEFDSSRMGMKDLSQSVAAMDREEPAVASVVSTASQPAYRRRSLLGAGVISLLAITIGIGVRWSCRKQPTPTPVTIPLIK